MNTQKNLTEGKIWYKLILYFLPIAAGTLFQQLYNTADAIIVGKFIGTEALAAVGGSVSILTNLLITVFVALTNGCAVIIAQVFGAGKKDQLSRGIGTAISVSIIIGAAVTLFCELFSRNMLVMMSTPVNTLDDADIYLRIYFSASVIVMLANTLASILRAVGDSRSPFIFMVISCLANIALDLIFIIVLKLGVAGAALATIISQAVNMLLTLRCLLRKKELFSISIKHLIPDSRLLPRMLSIGLPAAMQGILFGISNTMLQTGVNILGTTVVAAWALSGKIDGFYWSTVNAAGSAVTNFVAQNYGAGRYDRIKETVHVSMKVFISITLCFTAFILLFARRLFVFFTDDAAVMAAAWEIVTYFVPYYFSWTVIEVLSGTMRGAGSAIIPTIVVAIGICLYRIIWIIFIFMPNPSVFTVSICYPISWVITAAALAVIYFRGRWLKKC